MGEKITTQPMMAAERIKRPAGVWMMALVLAVVSLLLYANTLKNDFALDDFLVIKANNYVNKGTEGLGDILTTPYHRGFIETTISNDQYRPVSLVVFALVHQYLGDSPVVYHLLNVLVFAGCVVLLFLFLHRLLQRKRVGVAFIAALLFALHPIHTEVVANCKSLDELLCFLLAFMSLNAFMDYAERGSMGKLLLGAGLFFVAFLSKETAVTFVAIVPFIFYLHKNDDKKRSLLITISIVVMAAIAIYIGQSILNTYNANSKDILFQDNPLAGKDLSGESRLATAVLILGYYVKLLIVPYPLICDYTYNSVPFTHFSDVWVLLSVVVYVGMVGFAVWRLRKDRKDLYAFGIVFYLVTIALFSNIVFLIGSNMAERFEFFPSVGYCLIVALLIGKWVGEQAEGSATIWKQPKVLAIMVPLALVYGFVIINRNADWKDNTTLYTADLEKRPDNNRLYFFLGNELVGAVNDGHGTDQQLRQGIDYLEQANKIYPESPSTHLELARGYALAKNYKPAEDHLYKAIELNPRFIKAANMLGTIYLNTNRIPRAIEVIKEVLHSAPNDVDAHFNLASCYGNVQRYAEAIEEYRTSIRLAPTYNQGQAFEYIAMIYTMTGKPDSANMYRKMRLQYNH